MSERTRFSRTFRRQDGTLTTRVSEAPVNFTSDGGETWRAIDNELVPGTGAVAARNVANAYEARLPDSLADPVVFEVGARWVSFAMQGAQTDPPVVEGDTATYVVSPQVTARYTAHGSGVREALTLASAQAPSRFSYRVEASAGLTPRLARDGGVLFVDGGERVRFGFSAPTLVDDGGVPGRAEFALERDGAGWTLTVRADRAWLEDPARAFPVVLDPDVYWVDGALRFSGADEDCTLDSTAPTSSTCGLPTLGVGTTVSGQQKSILRFAVEDAIPPDAQVLEGWFGLYVENRTGSASSYDVELHRLTESWTNAATWNTRDGSQAWSGSAVDPAVEGPVRTMGSAGFWTGWTPTELVQKWIARELPNHGFVLLPAAGAPQTQFTFTSSDGDPSQAPYIDVEWQPSVGQVGHYTYLDAPSTDAHALQVNPANGNVMIEATDATLDGFEEGYSRTFNAQGTWTTWGTFGPGWTAGIASGIYVNDGDSDESVEIELPDGASMTFHRNPNGTLRSPDPSYASMTDNGNGTYTLRLADRGSSGTDYTVHPGPQSWAPRSATRDGQTISVGQEDGNAVRSISDGTKSLTQDRDNVGVVSVVDPGVGTTTFVYDSNGQLTDVERPGIDTEYSYAGHRGAMTQIAEGTTAISLTYDAQTRVTSIRRTTASETTWMTFAYASASAPCNPSTDAGKTTVTGSEGVTVYCYDRTLHVTSQHAAPAVAGGQLGLENYFSYESMPTGLETAAHVNAANGNLVWHSTPLFNPGRGLSSVVNLSYNSFDHGGYLGQLLGEEGVPDIGGGLGSLKGAAYGEAGIGFSLGISGITRLNEPLTGVNPATDPSGTAQQIKLTDTDGTRHVFTRMTTNPYPGTWYTPPAGVELALRYQPSSVTDPLKRWAATRPDGVTFYFDAEGYQTLIVDRNGNTIRYEYERYSKTTGEIDDCNGTPAASLLCTKRVARVVDPKGVELAPTGPVAPNTPAGDRALHILYEPDAVLPGGAGAYPPSELVGPVGGRAGRIEQIIDHKGRTLDLCYDADGYLIELEWWGGQEHDSDARSMLFEYTGTGAGRQLSRVRDPEGHWTEVAYDAELPGTFGDGSTGRRATSVTSRRENETTFTYATNTFTATAPGAADTTYGLLEDGTGRVDTITNDIGAVTKLEWSADNYLASYELAHGTTQAAKTQVLYTRLGDVQQITDPLQRVTTLDYEYGSETGITNGGVDDGTQYVADLTSIRRPKEAGVGAPTVAFDNDIRGNVITRTYAGKTPAYTTYDSWGQVATEQDERGHTTSFFDYDANGLPQRIVDPRETAGETVEDGNGNQVPYKGTWQYRYDDVGNLLTVTDPRGTATAAGSPYTTSYTVDGFDQVTASQTPKCTDSEDCPTPAWIERSMTYDDNGNQLTVTDARNQTTNYWYTPMDQIEAIWAPPETHHGNSTPVREATTFEYDARENRTKIVSPNGNETATVHDYTTLFAYDTADRLTSQIRRSRGTAGPCSPSAPIDCDADLVTSYAYDLRDNLVGIVDPNANAAGGDPEDNAELDSKRRWTYIYDVADNRTDEIEDPDGLYLRTRTTYDANDNVESVISPRGMTANGPAGNAAMFTTTYAYDVRDDIVSITRGGTRTTAYGRFDDGMIKTVTSPKGVATDESTPEDDHDYETAYAYNANGEISELTLPRAVGEPRSASTIEYTRNAVGDPIEITDPRGNAFTNTFYDTGHVRSSTRPSWWTVELGADVEVRERTPDEWLTFDGSQRELPTGPGDFGSVNGQPLPDLLPRAGETTFNYSAEMELTCVTDVAGNRTTLDRDALGRLRGLIQPFEDDVVCGSSSNDTQVIENQQITVQRYGYDYNGNLRAHTDGREFVTTTAYDQFDRWVSRVAPGTAETAPTTDPGGGPIDLADLSSNRTSAATWDANGNQTVFTDPENRTTTNAYDPADRLIRVTDNADHVTDYGYDVDGNLTCTRTPRGATNPPSACDPASGYSTVRAYNRHSELIELSRKAVFGGGTQEIVTEFDYDLNGNQTLVSAAGAERAPGEAIDPFVTLRVFDGRDRLWRERRGTPHSADANSEDVSRTVYEYDATGNLRRVVNSKAIDSADGTPLYTDDGTGPATGDQARHATVYVTSDDNLLTDRFLPWGFSDARDQRRYRQHFDLDQRGRVNAIDAPYDPDHDPDQTNGKEDGARVDYSFFANGWIASAADQRYTGAGRTGLSTVRSFHYEYDRQGNQTMWRRGAPGSDNRVWRQYYPDGSLGRRVAYDNSQDQNGRRYSYGFYGDGQLAQFKDGNLGRTTNLAYDSAARLSRVEEDFDAGRDTKYRYDEDGNIKRRWTDGKLDLPNDDYDGGKSTQFTYDSIGREREMLVTRSGQADRETLKTYWPSGHVRRVTRPNDTVDETYLDTQGRVRRKDRTPDGANTRIHGYFYDNVGNRTHDDKGDHAYNARSQLVQWTRDRDAGDPMDASTVSYQLNGSGGLVRSADTGANETVQYRLRGDELDRAEISIGGSSATRFYEHDSATGDLLCAGATTDNQSSCPAGVKYSYDAFSRMTLADDTSAPTVDKSGYRYDGFDRRDSRCTNSTGSGCTQAQTREYAYIGLTESLSSTSRPDGGGTVHLYDYDSNLNRLGQDKDPSGGGSNTYRSYFTDPNGTVIGLEDDNGAIPNGHNGSGNYSNRAIYDFDPYGQPDIGEGALTLDAGENPFRYDGFEYDSSVATYDMQARAYRPDIARFTTADRFEDALGDFALQSDPLTQNRFAFGAGSPINNVEVDGHEPATSFDRDAKQVINDVRPESKYNDSDVKKSGDGPDMFYQGADGESLGDYSDGPGSYSDEKGRTAWEQNPTQYGCQSCPSQATRAAQSAERRERLGKIASSVPTTLQNLNAEGCRSGRHIRIGCGDQGPLGLGPNSGGTRLDPVREATIITSVAPASAPLREAGKRVAGRACRSVCGALAAKADDLLRGARARFGGGPTRLAQDVAVNPAAPRPLALTRSIGRQSHNDALQADIAALPAGARGIRVNQQQVNAAGQRVGINRPDLQYTLNGTRHYVEYEGPGNPRGAAHRARILANDPGAEFHLRLVK